jgi:hypothetical protein
MLAIGCGFFFWGIALHIKIQKTEKHKASNATEPVPMHESQRGESFANTLCVKPRRKASLMNSSNHTKKASERVYVSESEIYGLLAEGLTKHGTALASYEMNKVAYFLALTSLTDDDLSILFRTIEDSGIEERNIKIGMPIVGSPFPLRKGVSHVSFSQKREPPAITVPLTTMAPDKNQNSRIAGSSGRRRNKENTSKGKAGGGSYSPKKADEGQHSDDEFAFEAEDASSLTFEIGQDENASNSAYIYTPDTPDGSMNHLGTAEYNFEIEEAGVYKVTGRVLAQTPDSDSVYITMDNFPWYEWDMVRSTDWIWTFATQRRPSGSAAFRDAIDLTFELEAGAHTLKIRNREDGTKLDVLVIQRLQN